MSRATYVGTALAAVRARQAAAARIEWPSVRWRADPIGFCTDVLGMTLTPEQAAVACALRDSPRVAVAAGRKIGKSELAGALALWYYCSFAGATVVLTAPTDRTVERVIWKSIRNRVSRATLPLDEAAIKPATGMSSTTFPLRTIRGFSSKEREDIQGDAGNLLYIIDEASGVPDFVYETIEGNQAGGLHAKVLAVANPTRASGYFFECFDGRKFASQWRSFQISSLTSPNIITGSNVIEGLATRDWAERMLAAYGADSPYYKIHVLGQFCRNEQGRVIGHDVLDEALMRWAETPAVGLLHIGVDPAGPGADGDETAMAVRRGNKLVCIRTWRGLSEDAIWANLRGLLHEFRQPDETPCVVLDAGGAVGEPLAIKLKAISNAARDDHGFALVCVRANKVAIREPARFAYVRDELWACLASWLHEGGAIPEDDKLAGELQDPLWYQDARGRARVDDKDTMRKRLARSPDRCDALALAVWPSPNQVEAASPSQSYDPEPADTYFPESTINPYGGSDWAHRR